jgi:adenylate cyclase class 2
VPIETEIKLRLRGSPGEARALLERLGYRAAGPRQLQVDQLFDRAGELRAAGKVLRLRSAGGRWLLTFKGPAARSPHKSRLEIETEVAGGAALAAILEALGFQPVFVYEKYRTEFHAPGQPGLITLDETPIGDFLELEGPGDWIDSTVKVLGYTAKDYVVASYATLYREHCERHGGVPSAMRF